MRGDFMDQARRWEDLDKEMRRRCEAKTDAPEIIASNSDRWYVKCCRTCAHISWFSVGSRHTTLRECCRENKDRSPVVSLYECCQHFEWHRAFHNEREDNEYTAREAHYEQA
jgi:hypothetical protein